VQSRAPRCVLLCVSTLRGRHDARCCIRNYTRQEAGGCQGKCVSHLLPLRWGDGWREETDYYGATTTLFLRRQWLLIVGSILFRVGTRNCPFWTRNHMSPVPVNVCACVLEQRTLRAAADGTGGSASNSVLICSSQRR